MYHLLRVRDYGRRIWKNGLPKTPRAASLDTVRDDTFTIRVRYLQARASAGPAVQPKSRNPSIPAMGGEDLSLLRSGLGRAVRVSLASRLSSAAATLMTKASPPRGPTIWRPNGIPCRSSPTGNDSAGCPASVTA